MTELAPAEIVSFSKPPIVEVVCGAQFHELPLQTSHFGQFLQRVAEKGYRKTRDVSPLPPILEQGGPATFATLSWAPLPELRRVFFVDEDRGRLLQLQSTRYHHNWQRRAEADIYPRFQEIREEFLDRWAMFREFLLAIDLPVPHVSQAELTYINHIPLGELWDGSGYGKIFPWLQPQNGACAAVPDMEIALHYEIPQCRGRLHVTSRTGLRSTDGARVLVVDLTLRGAPAIEGPDADLGSWLIAARETIVRSFVELTGPEAHAHWGLAK